jgi:hypothetical protein
MGMFDTLWEELLVPDLRESRDRGRDRGAAPVGLLAALGVVVAGGAAGVVLQRSGAVDPIEEDTVVAAYAEASFFDCPSGDALGVFVRGDRVYLVGRDESGGWVQVRSPRDTDQRVWIAAGNVAADAVVDLPVGTCAIEVEAQGVTDTMLVTDTTDVSPDTTVPGPGAPSVGSVSASPATISEGYAADTNTCADDLQPIRSTVTATVSAPGGVQSVVMRWSVGDLTGSTPMTLSGSSYRATLGKFSADDPSPVPNGQTSPITVTVTVTDNQGRTATGGTTVTLTDCTFE